MCRRAFPLRCGSVAWFPLIAVCSVIGFVAVQCAFRSSALRRALHGRFADARANLAKGVADKAYEAHSFVPFARCAFEEPRYAGLLGGCGVYQLVVEDSLHCVRFSLRVHACGVVVAS